MNNLRLLVALCATFLCLNTLPSHAELINRGGGLIYDTALDITWLQDAGLANTQLGEAIIWLAANVWASNLVYAGYSDWRLPNMDIDDDGTFVDCRLSSVTETECKDNEFSYMYVYNGITFDTPGIISNLGSLYYWSSTESPLYPGLAMLFKFTNGLGGITSKITSNRQAWAVRDGDSVAPAADGDLAPLGAPDGHVNAGDLLIATRIVLGELASTPLEVIHGDVYPPGAPDGVINIQDLMLITQLAEQ